MAKAHPIGCFGGHSFFENSPSYFCKTFTCGSVSDAMTEADSDYVDDEESGEDQPPPPRARSTRARKDVEYVSEKRDNFFSDLPGYTDFHRTRKGGDRRPFAAKKPKVFRLQLFVFRLQLTFDMKKFHDAELFVK